MRAVINMEAVHAQLPDEVSERFGTDPERGLDDAEAASRFERYGPNILPAKKKLSPILRFAKQFHHGLTYVLFAAAAVSFAVGKRSDAYGIILAVLINVVVSFLQERRAEKAIEHLREFIVPESSVVRGGKPRRIPSERITPGDILLLAEGDRIAADAYLLECKELRVNESSLTGESAAVEKSLGRVDAAEPPAERTNMIWAGTTVVGGAGRAVAVEIGSRTMFGGIAASLAAIKKRRTPFEASVNRFGRQLGLAAVVLAGAVYAIGRFRGFPLIDVFLFAVASVVSVVPEGLPAVLAIVLAIGARRMAKKNAVIRHLPSVETLGVTDVICADKTGTLTENKMTAREIVLAEDSIDVTGEGWEPRGEFRVANRAVVTAEIPAAHLLLKAAGFCSQAALEWRGDEAVVIGDPTDGALAIAAEKAGLSRRRLESEFRLIDDLPFSSRRKYRAVLAETGGDGASRERLAFIVGAYETIVEKSSSILAAGGQTQFDEKYKIRFNEAHERMASGALRVLAVAYKEFSAEHDTVSDEDARDMTLLGLVGMMDPPRRGVAQAIARCRGAGIRIIMLTGDHKTTAVAIGKEIGLFGDGRDAVYMETDVVGTDDESFARLLEDAAIFARVSPETKLRIVDTLEAAGHTVAMTGDGVNDAPALKRASIGIAMGQTGTDVAKDVSDMVLSDDDFVTIVNAVEQGRVAYRNVKQAASYLFMTNVGEIITVLIALTAGLPLPLTAAQILWLNLVTDGFPDVALATEKSHGDLLSEPPRSRSAGLLTKNTFVLTGITAALMCAATLALFIWAQSAGDIDYARSVAFTALAVSQLWNAFNMRSESESLFKLGLFSNRAVLAAVAASLALLFVPLYVPSLAVIFQTKPIGLDAWLLILAATSPVFFAIEAYKVYRRRTGLVMSWR